MQSPTIYVPESIDESVELISGLGDEAKIMSGGTALMIMMKNGLVRPDHLVWLGRVPGLGDVKKVDGFLELGARVTLRQLAVSPTVRQVLPTLAQAVGLVANRRVRTVATVGGNVAEADYASDPPTVLSAFQATIVLRSVRGTRIVPISDFLVDYYETAAASDELVEAVRVPLPSPATKGIYLKYVTRSVEDRPCVGVAVRVESQPDGTCATLAVAVGAATAVPLRLPEIEQQARGRRLGGGDVTEIATAFADSARPISDLRGSADYRKRMIRVFVQRALERVLAGETGASQE